MTWLAKNKDLCSQWVSANPYGCKHAYQKTVNLHTSSMQRKHVTSTHDVSPLPFSFDYNISLDMWALTYQERLH